MTVQLIVIAKEPVPGRVKTRLTPPFSPAEAASLAAAALTDTLGAVAGTELARRVLALDGQPGPWLPPGFEVIPQRGGGLDERIAAAMTDAWRVLPVPVLLIGMDTPQVTPELLAAAAAPLTGTPAKAGTSAAGAADAVFGPADDGGFWLLGLREPDPALLLGVPMSRPDTGAAQLARLRQAGLRVAMLPCLTDVDTAESAEAAAAARPGSEFATRLRELRPQPATVTSEP